MCWFNPAAVATLMAAVLMEVLPVSAAEAPGLIFDTDICGDCDDVLALGMIHALQSRGACKLLAVTVSVDNDLAAPFVDAVNTFYGRGDIPIGVVGKGGVVEQSKYLGLVEEKEDDGRYRYPHNLPLGQGRAPRDARFSARSLAAQPDQSVVIAQVGFSTNLARLLDIGRRRILDPFRHRAGQAQGQAAVAHGRRLPADRRQRELSGIQRRCGTSRAARSSPSDWPTPMVFSGFEIGIALPYPATSIERDYGYVPHHPLAEAYIRYIPPPHNRPTWDLTAVLFAVLGDRGYFDVSPRGRATIHKDGSCRFEETSQRLTLVPDTPSRAEAARARGPGPALQPASSMRRETTAMNMKPLKSNYSAEPAS